MRKFVPLAAAGVWLLVVAGTAMAQIPYQGPLPPTGPSSLAITAPGLAPPLPTSVVGTNLLTNTNEIIGNIVGIQGDALLVRPGSHFGFGPRAVIVPHDYVYITGDTVRTHMTGTHLRTMTPYLPPKTAADMRR